MSQGVEAGRIRTSSYGKERPVEVCSTPECQVKNRRAVTIVDAEELGGAMTEKLAELFEEHAAEDAMARTARRPARKLHS